MHGQIPHRLPEAHAQAGGRAKEGSTRAPGAGGGGGIDYGFVDEFRSDFAAPDSEGVSPSLSSSSAAENDRGAAGTIVRDLTEEEGREKAAGRETSNAEGEGEGEGRAAATSTSTAASDGDAAAAAAATASTPSSTPTKASPRPSWPPPRRPKKTYQQLQLPSPEQMAQEEAMNNCGVRTALSGVMGAGLGVVFGIFMGTMDMAGPQAGGPLPPAPAAAAAIPPVTPAAAAAGAAATTTAAAGAPATPSPLPVTPPKQSVREVLRATALSTKQRCVSYSKGFGAMGALFAGSECVIEKARAKHDIYNAVYAGCAAGGALAASGGIKAAGFGCVSFAAFSAFIEKVMQHD